MEKYECLSFKKCELEDIPDLAKMMRDVFTDEINMYHLDKLKFKPIDEGKLLTKYIVEYKATAYCIYIDNKLKGFVLYWANEKDARGLIGEIFLSADIQNCGVGQIVWKFVLKKTPEVKVWRIETPMFAKRNLNFFVNKLGFHIIEIKKPKEDLDSTAIFELKL